MATKAHYSHCKSDSPAHKDRRFDPVSLCRYLIDIPGLSGDETPLLNRLAILLRNDLGMRLQRIPVDGKRFCLFARDRAPLAVLSSHVDTVAPFFATRVLPGKLLGRGACDSRGIIAAMLVAGIIMHKKGKRRFGYLFLPGEENSHDGARAAAEFPTSSRFLINGEPTDCQMALGSKGAMRVLIRTQGRPCHSSVPSCGKSAIDLLLDILNQVRQTVWPESPYFGKTLVNIGTIQGGEQANILAKSAQAVLMFRLACCSDTVKKKLLDLIGVKAELQILSVYEPLRCHSVAGFPTKVVGFGTDLPYLGNWGKPYLFGPGSILNAHSEHENISVPQLYQACRDYQRIITALTGAC